VKTQSFQAGKLPGGLKGAKLLPLQSWVTTRVCWADAQ